MQIERTLEVEKQALVVSDDFNLSACYALFAPSPVTRLNPNDLSNAMLTLKVNCDERQATLLCARYDSDEDGKLGFWELANMFMPRNQKLQYQVE